MILGRLREEKVVATFAPSVGTMALAMVWKAALFYGILLILLRLMGKREVSSFTPLDLVVSIMLAEAAVISIEDDKIPVLAGVAPVLLLAGLQIGLAWLSLKSRFVRRWLEGPPAIVVKKGIIDAGALRKQRMNIDELLSNLRLHNIAHVRDVEYAVLEPSGRLSVIPKAASVPPTAQDLQVQAAPKELPVAVIVDGVINRDGISSVNGDEKWLREGLRLCGDGEIADVLVAMYDPIGKLVVQWKSRSGQAAQPKVVSHPAPKPGPQGAEAKAKSDKNDASDAKRG